MNLSLLPRDEESLAFDSNCALVDDPQGSLHVIARHIAPCTLNKTKPVSSILHHTLSQDFHSYTSTSTVVACDNRTPLLYHYEDPRIVRRANGEYYMLVCSWGGQYFDDGVNFYTAGHQMLYTLSADFKVQNVVHPVYGFNGRHHFANLRHEKNWIPILRNEDLYIAYGLTPHRVFRILDDYTTEEHITDGITDWGYGTPSGGTPLVPFDDKTSVGLFHSFTLEGVIRTYHVGAYLVENDDPFRILRWSRKPLITAHKEQTTSPKFYKQSHYFLGSTAPSSHKHHHAVVYPCGMVRRDDFWMAGCGINDITGGLLTFTTKELEATL